MAPPKSAQSLVDALRAEGLEVIEVGQWRTHNRNQMGAWGPLHGVMNHHTVTSGSANTVKICYNGYTGLPGPLCHGVITKDGRVHLVGWGRANHAGKGDDQVLRAVIDESYDGSPPVDNEANVDGNPHFIGFECENMGDGEDPWPLVQYIAMVKANVAVHRLYGWTEKSSIGHKEWQPGKSDPRGEFFEPMSKFRTDIKACLALPRGVWNGEDEVALSVDDVNKVADAVFKKLVAGGGILENEDIRRILHTDNLIDSPDKAETNPYWALASYVRYGYLQDKDTNDRLKKVEDMVSNLQVGGVDLDALANKVADLLASRLAQ